MLAAFWSALLLFQTPTADHDFSKIYPATLDHDPSFPALEWSCTGREVWSLSSFGVDYFDQLEIELGPSQVVFGTQESNVLWAVVIPNDDDTHPGSGPRRISAPHTGNGEEVEHVFLRFHPSIVGELFPPSTILGRGDPKLHIEGKRVFQGKINAAWQSGGRPVIPTRQSSIFDVDTCKQQPATDSPGTSPLSRHRRFYAVNTDHETVKYEAYFAARPLPLAKSIGPLTAAAIFDQAWREYDTHYAGFGLLPTVDWAELRERWRPLAASATDNYTVAAAIGALIEPLDDFHAWVVVDQQPIPLKRRARRLNGNWRGTGAILGGVKRTPGDMVWARTRDGIGYINIFALNKAETAHCFDEALEQFADTWGLIIDLRFNGGGDEILARKIAGRFLSTPAIYSRNRYRAGPNHDDLGPLYDRVCEARGPWRYEGKVLVLIGQHTMSSAESLVLMLSQAPDVTTLGDRTAGSSGNPKKVDLGHGIQINVPRWLDLDTEGRAIEHVGIAPDKELPSDSSGFSNTGDAVLQTSLELLRETPETDRKVAKPRELPGRAGKY